MTIDVPIDVPDDVLAEYERVAREKGTDVEMVIGLDVQGITAAHFDEIMTGVEQRLDAEREDRLTRLFAG